MLRARFKIRAVSFEDMCSHVLDSGRAIDLQRNSPSEHPAYTPLSYLGFAPPWETEPAQRAAGEKALLLDGGLAEAHLSLALVMAYHERRWGDAEAAYRRGLELDPNYATGHHWYAFFLMTVGRFDEALDERRRALEIDPLTPMLSVGLADLHIAMRRPDLALDAVKQTLERHPDSGRRAWLEGRRSSSLAVTTRRFRSSSRRNVRPPTVSR